MLTTLSPIVGPPTASDRQIIGEYAKQYQARQPSSGAEPYTLDDLRAILWAYTDYCPTIGLDTLAVTAQMALETTWLASDWAAVPNRNPAGIGVTGQPGVGLRFPSWSDAMRAHCGRLLAYALPLGAETPRQDDVIAEALHWRPLSDSRRGIAPTVGKLAGTWAADLAYGTSIANRGNAILD